MWWGGDRGRRLGRQWALRLADRVLLVRDLLADEPDKRQIGPLFGVSHSAAHRVIDQVGPVDAVAIQVAIDAETRLVIATGDPQPGNRNDCTLLPPQTP